MVVARRQLWTIQRRPDATRVRQRHRVIAPVMRKKTLLKLWGLLCGRDQLPSTGHPTWTGTHWRRQRDGDDFEDRHAAAVPVDVQALRAEGVEVLAEAVQEVDGERCLLHEEDGGGLRDATRASPHDHREHAAAVAVLQAQADGGVRAEDRLERRDVRVAQGTATPSWVIH